MTYNPYGDTVTTVFARSGEPLERLPGVPYQCAWSLNEAAPGEFVMSTRFDDRARRSLLQFGNIVEFQHAHLGRWGGVICPQDGLGWSGTGELSVKLRTGYYQFTRRRTPLYNFDDSQLYVAGGAASVMTKLIAWANLAEDTRLRPTYLHADHQMMVKLQNVMMDEAVSNMLSRKKKGLFFWTEGGRDDSGKFVFDCHLSEARAARYTGLTLIEDVNIETPSSSFFRVSGDLANDVLAINMGEQDGGRKSANEVDSASVHEYGLFEDTVAISAEEQDALFLVARENIKQRAWTKFEFTLSAIETPESPNTFLYLRPGVVARVKLHSVGFYKDTIGYDGYVVIKSMEYSSIENKVALNVQTIEEIGYYA